MELSPRQIESWAASTTRDHFTIWDGAIRSGKTVISLIAFIHWLSVAPRGPIAILGKTRTTIIRNVLDVITMIAPQAIGRYGLSSDRVQIMGRWVWLVGANDAQAEAKIRGLTLAGAYVDEATLLPEAMFVQLLGRLSVKDARLFATTNPDSPSHWLKTNYIDRVDQLDGWGFWHFTMDDNPGLTPEYVAAKKKEFTGLWYRRFIEGEWVSAEGAVYDMWDPTTHIVPWENLPNIVDMLAIGIDYGTQNPTSGILLGLGEDDRLYAVDEWRLDASNRGHGTWTDAQQTTALLEWLNHPHTPSGNLQPRRFIVDPAAASFKTQLMRDGAWGMTDAYNKVTDGIRLVSNGLSAGWLRISSRCTGLISEFPGYSWDPKAQLAGEDKPIKTADHSLDALRYAVATTERMWRHRIRP